MRSATCSRTLRLDLSAAGVPARSSLASADSICCAPFHGWIAEPDDISPQLRKGACPPHRRIILSIMESPIHPRVNVRFITR